MKQFQANDSKEMPIMTHARQGNVYTVDMVNGELKTARKLCINHLHAAAGLHHRNGVVEGRHMSTRGSVLTQVPGGTAVC